MKQVAFIALTGFEPGKIDSVLEQLGKIAHDFNVYLGGPFYLPAQPVPLPYRARDGKCSINFLGLHQCQVFLEADERALRGLMRIQVPDGVNIEIILKN